MSLYPPPDPLPPPLPIFNLPNWYFDAFTGGGGGGDAGPPGFQGDIGLQGPGNNGSDFTDPIAIGTLAGATNQQLLAIAIGLRAGETNQAGGAIAIGAGAGEDNQGTNSIAIGKFAGFTDQVPNSIILNASGNILNSTFAGTYIDPIRKVYLGPQGGPDGPLVGVQGFQGKDGYEGVDGRQGVQGLKGLQGFQGFGDDGTQGFQGFSIEGIQGFQGFKGFQGLEGLQGDQGFQGFEGRQGFQGFQGQIGIGAQGTQGLPSIDFLSLATLSYRNSTLQTIPNDLETVVRWFNVNVLDSQSDTGITFDGVSRFTNSSGKTYTYTFSASLRYSFGTSSGFCFWTAYRNNDLTFRLFNTSIPAVGAPGPAFSSTFTVILQPNDFIEYKTYQKTGASLTMNMDGSTLFITRMEGQIGYQGVQGVQGEYVGISGFQGPQGHQGVQGPWISQDFICPIMSYVNDTPTTINGGQTISITWQALESSNSFGIVGLTWNGSTTFTNTSGNVLNLNVCCYITSAQGGLANSRIGWIEINGDTTKYYGFNTWRTNDGTSPGTTELPVVQISGDIVLQPSDFFTIRYYNQEATSLVINTRAGVPTIVLPSNPGSRLQITALKTMLGFQGIQGMGSNGVQGIQGLAGEYAGQGVQGNQGFLGIQGPIGDGPQGFFGFQGDKGIGFQGFQGFQGLQGVEGIQGLKGLQGFQGFQGDIGFRGFQGYQGSKGIQGDQGLPGEFAALGRQGNQGFLGLIGGQGNQGPALGGGNIPPSTAAQWEPIPLTFITGNVSLARVYGSANGAKLALVNSGEAALYISLDYGTNWIRRSAPTSSFGRMTSSRDFKMFIPIFPNSNPIPPSTVIQVYIVDNDGGTYNLRDITTTPSATGLNASPSFIASSSNGNILYMFIASSTASINGLYKSSNTGVSWSKLSTVFPNNEGLAYVFCNLSGSRVIVIHPNPIGTRTLFTSLNGGASFDGGIPYAFNGGNTLVSTDTLTILVYGSVCSRSVDGGANFTQLTTSFNSSTFSGDDSLTNSIAGLSTGNTTTVRTSTNLLTSTSSQPFLSITALTSLFLNNNADFGVAVFLTGLYRSFTPMEVFYSLYYNPITEAFTYANV